jgi:glutamate-1-semialdehyde 2,1-aminomutase
VPKAFAETTIALPFNSIAAVEKAFAERGDKIAAVIVEPIVGNMGCVPPVPGFLQALRELTVRHGALLIFDEVMTGFRVALGGAQQLFGIQPDLTTLGKIVGGGLPMAAYGGRAEIMHKIAPLGPVYQAGTLSGNPVAVAAGLATLKAIQAPGFYERLSERTRALTDGLAAAGAEAGIAFSAQSIGGMFGIYFAAKAPASYAEVMASDKEAFNRFFHRMLDAGVYLAPSAYEAGFVSAAHTAADVEETVRLASTAFALS